MQRELGLMRTQTGSAGPEGKVDHVPSRNAVLEARIVATRTMRAVQSRPWCCPAWRIFQLVSIPLRPQLRGPDE